MALVSKLPDERRRQLPKRAIIAQGLHPGPGTGVNDFDNPEGPDWDEVEEEVSHDDARNLLEVPEAWNDTCDDGPPELRRILGESRCPIVGPFMKTNPNNSVWRDPDDSEDDQAPHLAEDSSDDELFEDPGGEAALDENEHHYDTDDELGFDQCNSHRKGVCRGEAEEVLGRQ